ncbi:MAG: S41 family peptidase [Chloroflexota bacterium]|nr:MAG: S41 family peptidase [Chloroflexota bacterium]
MQTNWRPFRLTLMILLALLLFSGGYVLGQSSLAPIYIFGPALQIPSGSEQFLRPFVESWQLLHDEYFDQPLDDDSLLEGALDGMLGTLGDPNTRYLSPEQEEAARQAQQGNLEGIGAEVTEQDGAIVIVAPFEGSPAEAAGLKPGDILLKADDEDLSDMSVAEAAALVRGPAGTQVRLVLERSGEMIEVTVTRDVIRVPSVRGEILDDGLIYVRLSRFGNQTARELEETLDSLLAGQPIGMILDLRGNPGGSLNAVVEVADQFLDQGLILTQRYGDGRERVFEADEKGLAQDIGLVVLIDEGSASASEVLAGAIRDSERGVLLGATSFGKGTVQDWQRLSNGGGLRLTTARWLTPSGDWVHESGLDADIPIAVADSEGDSDVDVQLQQAINYLLGKPLVETSVDQGN